MSTLAELNKRAPETGRGGDLGDDTASAAPPTRGQSVTVTSSVDGSGSASGLHRAIAELAGALNGEPRPDADAVLARFAGLAVAHLHCVHHCGVMLSDAEGRLCSAAATDDFASDIQQIQQMSRQGPCCQAASRRHSIRIDDVTDEMRWPRFSHAVIDRTPVRSLLSVPLDIGAHRCGVLSLYSDRTYAFDSHVQESAKILATHMALAWQNVERLRQLEEDRADRDIINQASGIMMERYEMKADAALALMSRLSEQICMPVVSIAEEVVGTHHLASG